MLRDLTTLTLRLPTQIDFAEGSSDAVGRLCDGHGYTAAFVVIDPGLHDLGLADAMLKSLDEAGIAVEIWTQVQPNPITTDIEAAAAAFNKAASSVVIGIGGGSALDTAKGVALLATNGGQLADYSGNGRVPNRAWPLVLVPTTAGTGSEVSASISVTDAGTKDKLAIRDMNNCASFAVLDPNLLAGLPASVAANSGMDALTHAVESMVSNRATAISRLFAYEAARRINDSIEAFVTDRSDIAHGGNMLYASCLAGVAFSHTGTGNAHAISRALGGRYGIIHGLGCGVALEPVMRFNLTEAAAGYAELATAFGIHDDSLDQAANAERAVERVAEIRANVGLPQRLDVTVAADEMEVLATWTVENSTPNPRKTTSEDARQLILAVVSA